MPNLAAIGEEGGAEARRARARVLAWSATSTSLLFAAKIACRKVCKACEVLAHWRGQLQGEVRLCKAAIILVY